MAHLNIYLSREREAWLRKGLDEIARGENRSLSYIVEEALVRYMQQQGKRTPQHPRKDHRTRAHR